MLKKKKYTRKQRHTILWFQSLSVRIFAGIMVLGALVGLLFFARPTTSNAEKRTLTEFPKLTAQSFWSGDFFHDLALWYSDTYPMRDTLIAADRKLENLYGLETSSRMVGNQQKSDEIPEETQKVEEKEVEKVSAPDSHAMEAEIQSQIRKNLYVKDDAAYELYYYKQEPAEIYTTAVNHIAEELKGKTDVYSILIPNNSGVLLSEEELSALGGSDQGQAIDYYYSLEPNAKTIDTMDILREHNDEYLYFRTDHHWTQNAAYYVYTNFCEEKGIEPNQLSDFEKKTFEPFLGTFYDALQSEAMAANPDKVEAYIPMATNELTFWDKEGKENKWEIVTDVSTWNKNSLYSCFISGDEPLVEINNPKLDDGSSCAVLKESYGNCFVPFLVDHYQTVYVIDFRYTQNNVLDFVKEHQIKDLIVMNNITLIGSKKVSATIAGLLT